MLKIHCNFIFNNFEVYDAHYFSNTILMIKWSIIDNFYLAIIFINEHKLKYIGVFP